MQCRLRNGWTEEAEEIGTRLGVRSPRSWSFPTWRRPMLWCLGRPKLLVPGRLIKSIDVGSLAGHPGPRAGPPLPRRPLGEPAGAARGPGLVVEPALLAGRRRLDAEAELACDAWVVWALPDDRLTYAEVLFQICSEFSRARSAAPALGVAGSGRFFERRLTMILRDHVSCRVSPLLLLAACLLALLALAVLDPRQAGRADRPDQEPPSMRSGSQPKIPPSATIDDDDDETEDDDDATDDDDDDDDDDQESADEGQEPRRPRDSQAASRGPRIRKRQEGEASTST